MNCPTIEPSVVRDPRRIPAIDEPARTVFGTSSSAGLRVRTALRAGDMYMQMPKGSNNRLNNGG